MDGGVQSANRIKRSHPKPGKLQTAGVIAPILQVVEPQIAFPASVKKPPIRAYAEAEVIAMKMLIPGRKILPKKESETAAKAEEKEGAHRFLRKNAKSPPDVQGKNTA
jgi:hypothetical protein